MDAYLASGHLNEASHFYLNINFEVLNGCKLKCPGCHVDKTGQRAFSVSDFESFDHLMNDLKKSLYKPFIAFAGPTDFLSADNFIETFTDEDFKEIIHNFKRLSLQTTYLESKNMEAVAAVLREHYADMEIELNLVVDPAKIMDDNYLALIDRNKRNFISLLKRDDIRSFGIMNVYDYDQTKIPQLLRDYDFMHNRVAHLFETTIDYNFSFGRNPDISNEEFLSLTNRIKNLFNHSLSSEVSDDQTTYLRFSFGRLTDSLIERQYNYRNGKLYYSPLLYERFVSFRTDFEVPLTNFTASEIEQFEMQVQMLQYSHAAEKDECEACPFLASCIDRGILMLMDTYGSKACLVAKNALFAVNTMGALPIQNAK